MPPDWILSMIATIIGGVALFLVKRSVARVDALEARASKLNEEIHEIRLSIAKELPTKEDFTELKREVQSVSATMHEVRDMVIRLEERNKSN